MLIAPISTRREAALLHERTHMVRTCIVYLLLERRNAWHSTRLNQYSSSQPAFTSLTAAKLAAEARRKAGSYFVIEETPALAFDLDRKSLVVINLNTAQPFKNWAFPSSFSHRESPLLAKEVLQAFSEEYVGLKTSGWIHGPVPTVLIGVTETPALSVRVGESACKRWVSHVVSGAMLYTCPSSGQDVNPCALDHIAWVMGHRGLTEAPTDSQRLRVSHLATQLQMDTRTLRVLLEDLGAPAKGPRSWIEPRTVEEVRMRLLTPTASPHA